MSKEDEEKEREPLEVDTVESQISAFAAKIGQETDFKYTVYIYRMIKNEETGRYDRPFIAKFSGIEPDPQQIAEKYRCGKYLISFIWKKGKEQKSKSYTLEVDSEAFPPLPKNGTTSLIPAFNNSGLSESMQMQLAMMQTIGEVMKEAYRSGGNGGPVRADPLETFSGVLEAVETGYSRAMAIQSKIMERVFARSMEQRFGLTGDGDGAAAATAEQEPAGIIGQYAPVVKEIVDGLKTLFSFFGEKVPPDMVKKVRSDERFKALINDPKALLVVGQALRREFGDERAKVIMKSFGVNMVIKQPPSIARTPDIPGYTDVQGSTGKGNGKGGTVSGQVIKAGNRSRGSGKKAVSVK